MSDYLRVISPCDIILEDHENIINTTSRSDTWSRGLSPFFLGPLDLYDDYVAQNMENAWQYAKVYGLHVDGDGDPTHEYFDWAKKGWDKKRADRYPMGKGSLPMYSYWDGEKLTYTEAREKIYLPLYRQVSKKTAFKYLEMEYRDKCLNKKQFLYLWDFDGYDHKKKEKSYYEVLTDPKKKMGHAFILAMLLEFGVDFTIEDLK